MPYMNKRNRFVQAAKSYAESNLNGDYSNFKKSDLLIVAKTINMKGIPTWVLTECKSAVSKGVFDMTSLIAPLVTTT